MPPVANPPPLPAATVAPTPSSTYNLSEHAPSVAAPSNKKLTDALNRHAGKSPSDAPAEIPGQARIIPSQPPRAPLGDGTTLPATDDKPAPHVKFIAADDQEPSAPTVAPDSKPLANEPAPEVLKSASAQIREAYERQKADLIQRATEGELTKKELLAFKAKATQYEDRIKALESAEGRAKELEKQVLTMDEQLRVTNYTQHPEFHEKFTRPVSEALQAGRAMVKEIMVQGESRLGTDEDFDAVLAQPNYTLAADKAVELFGERMGVAVFEESKRVKRAQQARAQAFNEASLRSQEWAKSQQARAAEGRTKARSEFDRVAAELAARYPTLYTPSADDKEAVQARQKGEELARIIVDGKPEEMPPEAYLANVAKAYHRAASWPMHQLQLSRVQAELEATKARLAAYEKSTPDGGSRQQPGGVVDAGGSVVTKAGELEASMHASLAKRAGGRR